MLHLRAAFTYYTKGQRMICTNIDRPHDATNANKVAGHAVTSGVSVVFVAEAIPGLQPR